MRFTEHFGRFCVYWESQAANGNSVIYEHAPINAPCKLWIRSKTVTRTCALHTCRQHRLLNGVHISSSITIAVLTSTYINPMLLNFSLITQYPSHAITIHNVPDPDPNCAACCDHCGLVSGALWHIDERQWIHCDYLIDCSSYSRPPLTTDH